MPLRFVGAVPQRTAPSQATQDSYNSILSNTVVSIIKERKRGKRKKKRMEKEYEKNRKRISRKEIIITMFVLKIVDGFIIIIIDEMKGIH